jgi:hypothetical protein
MAAQGVMLPSANHSTTQQRAYIVVTESSGWNPGKKYPVVGPPGDQGLGLHLPWKDTSNQDLTNQLKVGGGFRGRRLTRKILRRIGFSNAKKQAEEIHTVWLTPGVITALGVMTPGEIRPYGPTWRGQRNKFTDDSGMINAEPADKRRIIRPSASILDRKAADTFCLFRPYTELSQRSIRPDCNPYQPN